MTRARGPSSHSLNIGVTAGNAEARLYQALAEFGPMGLLVNATMKRHFLSRN